MHTSLLRAFMNGSNILRGHWAAEPRLRLATRFSTLYDHFDISQFIQQRSIQTSGWIYVYDVSESVAEEMLVGDTIGKL